jgi:hypothetical protein
MLFNLRKIKSPIKSFVTLISILFVFYCSSFFGQYITFFLFDLILSIYLFSLFKNKLRFLFLFHPIIVFVVSLGFNFRFEDIGVGYTYMNAYDFFMNPSDYPDISSSFLVIGLKSSYIGVIPFLWLPSFIFSTKLGALTYFYSMSIWNLFCGIFFVKISKKLNSISNNFLFLLVLFFVLSPMSLEINNSIHRYHILILGFLLFFVSWIDLKKEKKKKRYLSILVIIFSVIVIALSKLALLFSILIFVFLDFILKKNIEPFKKLSSGILYVIFFMVLLFIYIIGFEILPQQYLYSDFIKGPINVFTQAPVLGYFVRILYSTLSPFPFLTFDQWDLYGGNKLFLIIHFFSCVIVLWLIVSFFLNLKKIVLLKYEYRVSAMLILCITLSLSFSAVGHNVYLSPAIPFLSIILINNKYLCNIFYPLGIIVFAEIVLFIT